MAISNLPKLNFSVPFAMTAALPVEYNAYFDSYDAAVAAAATTQPQVQQGLWPGHAVCGNAAVLLKRLDRRLGGIAVNTVGSAAVIAQLLELLLHAGHLRTGGAQLGEHLAAGSGLHRVVHPAANTQGTGSHSQHHKHR